jgi:glycosyltransferase involved in cell wall biosynthesis
MMRFNSSLPPISLVMPVRNEASFIGVVLDNIFAQDYPKDKLEVIIADGLSDDDTVSIINDFQRLHPELKILTLSNLRKIVPVGLNIAINQAEYDVIVRMDAHAEYPDNYLSRLVNGLKSFNADNIGGIVETCSSTGKTKSSAIAFAMGHPIGVGNSYFRIGSSAPKQVDTVPFGCFSRSVFDQIGLFDEELVRNQDDEFNGRMQKAGMKIFLLPDLKIKYHARDSFCKLFKMFYQYGLFKPLVVHKLKHFPSWRQLMPPFFVFFLLIGSLLSMVVLSVFVVFLISLMFYVLALVGVALTYSFKNNIRLFPYICWSFFVMHFSYGIGYLQGAGAILLGRKKVFKLDGISR